MAYMEANTFAAAPSMLDTETSSDADVVMARESPHPQGMRRIVLASGIAVAVVAAGAVSTSMAPHPAAQESSAAFVVSQAATMVHRMGCSNWNELLIGEEANSTAAKCKAKCGSTTGCHAYNVEEASSCPNKDGNEGKAKGTCYVFAKGCKEKKNNCWDLYKESNATNVDAMSKARMGCSNWASIKFETFTGLSAEQCGAKCAAEPTCKHYNIQVSDNPTCPGVASVGTCYLFNGDCQEKANDCWDLYDNLLFTTTTSAPGTTTR